MEEVCVLHTHKTLGLSQRPGAYRVKHYNAWADREINIHSADTRQAERPSAAAQRSSWTGAVLRGKMPERKVSVS